MLQSKLAFVALVLTSGILLTALSTVPNGPSLEPAGASEETRGWPVSFYSRSWTASCGPNADCIFENDKVIPEYFSALRLLLSFTFWLFISVATGLAVYIVKKPLPRILILSVAISALAVLFFILFFHQAPELWSRPLWYEHVDFYTGP